MKGVLPDKMLEELVSQGYIENVSPEQIQPSSIDLTLGNRAFKIEGEPGPGLKLDEIRCGDEIEINEWTELSPGITYAVELKERIDPRKFKKTELVHIHTNPKSSAGRTGMITKVWVPGSEKLDEIPPEYTGTIYSIITPRAFPIKIKEGVSINQLRIFYGHPENSLLDPLYVYNVLENKVGLAMLIRRDGSKIPASNVTFSKNGIEMGMNLPEGEIAVYRAKNTKKSVKFERGANKLSDFFYKDEMNRTYKLEKDGFYIVATKELSTIPTVDMMKGSGLPPFVGEILAYDEGSGEFRSHAAGFVEYGFGHDGHTLLIMEIHPHADIVVKDGSPVCLLLLYEFYDIPNKRYKGSYNKQGLTPGKYFKHV